MYIIYLYNIAVKVHTMELEAGTLVATISVLNNFMHL